MRGRARIKNPSATGQATQGNFSLRTAPCPLRSAPSPPKRARADISVLRLVDQPVRRDPRHHGAQLLADLFDLVLGRAAAGRLEAGQAGLVLQHPVAGEAAGLDVVQDAL